LRDRVGVEAKELSNSRGCERRAEIDAYEVEPRRLGVMHRVAPVPQERFGLADKLACGENDRAP
jgi:hypothetical protein